MGTKVKHPGAEFRRAHMHPLGLSVARTAQALGVHRVTLQRVLNGRAAVTPEMAIRMARATDTSAYHWLQMQTEYDLHQALRHARAHPEQYAVQVLR